MVVDVFLGRRYSNIVLMFGIINEPYADVPTLQNLCVVSYLLDMLPDLIVMSLSSALDGHIATFKRIRFSARRLAWEKAKDHTCPSTIG